MACESGRDSPKSSVLDPFTMARASIDWQAIFPAVTTPFLPDLSIDHEALARHLDWLIECGSGGVVMAAATGEGSSLAPKEQRAVLATAVRTVAGRVPVVAAVGAPTTQGAVSLARAAADDGADAIMVRPPYLYTGDWRETSTHFRAVIAATPLRCMLYNSPEAYGLDLTPTQVAELAEIPTVEALKEGSGDIRRVTAIRRQLGDRLAILVGLDDLVVEGVQAGADGWVSGLFNALPYESMRLFELARSGRAAGTRSLYDWFLPLLRLDVEPKFVQLIKLVQSEMGHGNERVRPPRLSLADDDRDAVRALIRERLACRPTI